MFHWVSPPNKKYASKEEAKAARNALARARYWQSNSRMRALRQLKAQEEKSVDPYQIDVVDPRPPLGVVLEHDFRCQLLSRRDFSAVIQGDPPPSYATAYWQTAYRKQAFFERNANKMRV